MDEPLTYLVAHLRDAILQDDRFTEQAVEVEAAEGRIVLRGEVATPDRRLGIVALVTELAPGMLVIDDLCVSGPLPPHHEPETL